MLEEAAKLRRETGSEVLRVGIVLNSKKKSLYAEIEPALRANPEISPVLLDLSRPLEEQGPIHVIIHKITSKKSIAKLTDYLTRNPKVLVFDPFESVSAVDNRWETAKKLADLCVRADSSMVRQPRTILIDKDDDVREVLKRTPISFPAVYKPLLGSDHRMALVFNAEGAVDFEKPFVLQEFKNHDSILYKLYIIGDFVQLVLRPSLANVTPEYLRTAPNFSWFGRISNANCQPASTVFNPSKVVKPTPATIRALLESTSRILGLSFFGIDLIRDCDTGIFYVIDINYFPGYYGVPKLGEKIGAAIKRRHQFAAKTESKVEIPASS
eukprot:TRINITY_DN4431_c0_g1_i2.p1 TRINITY_DN4431_c0_g1~~TRINITY_DN4431_c0_g1_i2.p1  ORF type:complete len:342 (-),score=10.46 TRINITY_DN4431_c0_g1_i2:93-1070(-)